MRFGEHLMGNPDTPLRYRCFVGGRRILLWGDFPTSLSQDMENKDNALRSWDKRPRASGDVGCAGGVAGLCVYSGNSFDRGGRLTEAHNWLRCLLLSLRLWTERLLRCLRLLSWLQWRPSRALQSSPRNLDDCRFPTLLESTSWVDLPTEPHNRPSVDLQLFVLGDGVQEVECACWKCCNLTCPCAETPLVRLLFLAFWLSCVLLRRPSSDTCLRLLLTSVLRSALRIRCSLLLSFSSVYSYFGKVTLLKNVLFVAILL